MDTSSPGLDTARPLDWNGLRPELRLLLVALFGGAVKWEAAPGHKHGWLVIGALNTCVLLDEEGLPELNCFQVVAIGLALKTAGSPQREAA